MKTLAISKKNLAIMLTSVVLSVASVTAYTKAITVVQRCNEPSDTCQDSRTEVPVVNGREGEAPEPPKSPTPEPKESTTPAVAPNSVAPGCYQ